MNAPKSSPRLAGPADTLNEVRFSLRELLAETEVEYQIGAFGQKKLRQAEVRKLFASRRRPPRPHGN